MGKTGTFKENRRVAWAVLAVCIAFSLLFSGSRALLNLRGDTEQIFYQGINGDGLCIDRDLEERGKCAYNLASAAAGYASIDKTLVENARSASDGLNGAASIGEKYQANLECGRAVEDLYTAMENTALSEKDRSFAYKMYKEFQSRADTIGRDVYNEKAVSFNRTLSAFPAGLIGKLTGVRPLELFDSDRA